MKKKILTLALVVVMIAIMLTSFTMAYFTDSDMAQNVMTSGNVQIVQNETDRNGVAFVNEQTLLPAVYRDAEGNVFTPEPGEQYKADDELITVVTGPDGEEMEMYGEDILDNVIDKVVSVTNKGTLPAYVRTILLVEDTKDGKLTDQLHMLWAGKNQNVSRASYTVTVNNQTYQAVVFTYKDPLEAGKTSKASLQQVWLDPNADNDWYDLLGDGKLEILALSQATQTTGFDDAKEALNTAFGDVTNDNVAQWLNEATGNLNVVTVPEG